MKECGKQNIEEVLSVITKGTVHQSFGEPFRSAFIACGLTADCEEVTAASYICSLFLSTILEGFPSSSLHTFVRYIREHYTLFTFDCRMYSTLLEKTGDASLKAVALISKDYATVFRECSKEEVKEAYDFFTNR